VDAASGPKGGAPSRRRVIWRRVRRTALVAFAVVFVWFSISFGSALRNPSYGTSLIARAAEWGRDHDLGWLVTKIEEEYYALNPPKVGGLPPKSAFTKGTTPPVHVPVAALPVPPRLRSPAGAWLPGEGVWHPAGRAVDGTPGIYTTQVRPDAVYTSYVVGVAWMDPRLLAAQLYSGSEVPGGGPFRYSAPISTLASRTLDAAFNAGFKMQDANGGYYTDGRAVIPLRPGAASLVVYRDGSATVGAWGSEVTMSSKVASVRQNLDLIVNGGQEVPGLLANDNSQWGFTLGGAYAVWRSGIGVTRDGALVYVGGPSLPITSLASLLVDAGAVRAMELDINTDWVQFTTYRGAPGQPVSGAQGASLLSNMAGAPSRYFESWWIRDFYTMSVRPSPDGHLEASLP
jgi:Phosphodiester glycosidase